MSGGNMSSGVQGLLFIFFTMGVGCVVRWALRRFRSKIPYTVLMLLFGCIVDAIAQSGGRLGDLGDAFEQWRSVDPHLFLTIFIPPLIFESASSVNFHIFRRLVGQALVLAVPGVLVAIGLTGCWVRMMYDSWSWGQCLLLGAIVSATDPVAVVSLLKQLGASKRLSTLIEAESLLNDGSAYVVFMVLLRFLRDGPYPSGGAVVSDVFQLAIGGVATGILCGVLGVLFLKIFYEDFEAETAVTLVLAFLTFIVAEEWFEVSGILAVVFMGLTVRHNKTVISPGITHALHSSWEMLAFFANTLVFVVSGIMVAFAVKNREAKDFGLLVVLYIGINLIRSLVVFMFFPILKRTGYGLTRKEAMLCVWGGLRGAIGLSMALMTVLNTQIASNNQFKELVLFHTAGIVFLTICINGLTTGMLVKKLGLAEPSKASRLLFRQVVGELMAHSSESQKALSSEDMFRLADWASINQALPAFENLDETGLIKKRLLADEVKMLADGGATLCSQHTFRALLRSKHGGESIGDLLQRNSCDAGTPSTSDDEELRSELTYRSVVFMRSEFVRMHHEGMIGRRAIDLLIDATDSALDASNEHEMLHDMRMHLDRYLQAPHLLQKLARFMPSWAMHRALRWWFGAGLEMASAYQHASEALPKMVDCYPAHAHELAESVFQAQRECAKHVADEKARIQEAFPQVWHSIQTNKAALMLLHQDHHFVTKLWRAGVLREVEYERMKEFVKEHEYRLYRQPLSVSTTSDDELVSFVLLHLGPNMHKQLKPGLTFQSFDAGEQIMGAQDNFVFINTRGICTVKCANGDNDVLGTKGKGSIHGLYSVLSERPKRNTLLLAKSHVAGFKIASEALRGDGIDEAALWKLAVNARLPLFFQQFFPNDYALVVRKMVQRSTFMQISSDQASRRKFIPAKAILLTGQAVSSDKTHEWPTVLQQRSYTFSPGAKLLLLRDNDEVVLRMKKYQKVLSRARVKIKSLRHVASLYCSRGATATGPEQVAVDIGHVELSATDAAAAITTTPKPQHQDQP